MSLKIKLIFFENVESYVTDVNGNSITKEDFILPTGLTSYLIFRLPKRNLISMLYSLPLFGLAIYDNLEMET